MFLIHLAYDMRYRYLRIMCKAPRYPSPTSASGIHTILREYRDYVWQSIINEIMFQYFIVPIVIDCFGVSASQPT